MLALAGIAVRLVPASRLVAWGGRPLRHVRRFSQGEIAWVSWAVDSIGDKTWIKAFQFVRALAAQAMLRRRGIASRICVVGSPDSRNAPNERAWLELSQDVIDVNGTVPRLTRLIEFGEQPARS